MAEPKLEVLRDLDRTSEAPDELWAAVGKGAGGSQPCTWSRAWEMVLCWEPCRARSISWPSLEGSRAGARSLGEEEAPESLLAAARLREH